MMRVIVFAPLLVAAVGKHCHSTAPKISDSWCDTNCNHVPPNCPSAFCSCKGPSPSPRPRPSPAPGPHPHPPHKPGHLPHEILGYYSWNWGAGSTGPARANMGCSFTGYTDVDKAIAGYTEDASWCCPKLLGEKLLTLGGGNAAGRFTAHALSTITSKAHTIKAAGFKGVMYDVEEVVGPSSSMAGHFAKSFLAMRKAGLIVGVTTSHSAPYHCDSPHDAVHFVKAWCADPNVDIISPQLYSSGSESEPELASTNSCKSAGCTWELFKHCKAEIAPSIVRPSHYSAAKHFFATKVNRTTKGYFMWAQTKGDVVV